MSETAIQRPGATVILERYHHYAYVSGNNVELAWFRDWGARLKQKLAEAMRPGSQYSDLRKTRARVDTDTIRIEPRETHIKELSGHFGIRDNNCKSMPSR